MPCGRDRILLHETGGISAGASFPSRRPGPRHILRRPPACIPNTSGESGTPTAGRETPIAYRYATRPGSRSAFFDHLAESTLEFGKTGCKRRAPGVKHDVPSRAEFRAMQAEDFAETPLDAIANHGASNRARHGKSQAGAVGSGRFTRSSWLRFHLRRWPRLAKRGEQGTGDAEALVISSSEFGGAENPGRSRKSKLGPGGGFNWRSERLFHR
jgi:hypothetical protein